MRRAACGFLDAIGGVSGTDYRNWLFVGIKNKQSGIQTPNSAALALILQSSQGRGQGACEPGRGRGF